MATSPTSRTLAHFRNLGIPICKAEHWDHYAQKTFDLFGFIDAVALLPDCILALQITSGSNVSARVKKITEDKAEYAEAWLQAGGAIEVWGWRQLVKVRGKKAKVWEPNIIEITLGDF